jgi:hypothetical protein
MEGAIKMNTGGRQSAKKVLTDLIIRETEKIQALETMRDFIAWDSLSENQEKCLWSFFITAI